MSAQARSPWLAEYLISVIAGPAISEEILGDFQENFTSVLEEGGNPTLWYWQQALYSAPYLLLLRLRNVSYLKVIQQCVAAMMVLSSIMVWEVYVAQRASWPLASQIPGLGIPARIACMGMYIILYSGALGAVLAALSLWGNVTGTQKSVTRRRLILVGCLATLPAVFYLVQPLTHDGTLFRLTQIGAILVVSGIALVRLGNVELVMRTKAAMRLRRG